MAQSRGDERLRRGDVLVAGPDDLVNARDRLGAVGQSGNRLRAPHSEQPSDPGCSAPRPSPPESGRGQATMISRTPATRAGIAVISKEEGRG